MANKETTKVAKSKKTKGNAKTVVTVSLFWILLASTIVAFILYGQWNFNKGVFEGISKTQAILQSK